MKPDELDWDLEERNQWLEKEGYDESIIAPVDVIVRESD